MKVAIVTVSVPFVYGGAEYLAESLRDQLIKRGCECELIAIPFKWYPMDAFLRSMAACHFLRFDSVRPDVVIGLKFPAYLTPWPDKKVWLLHQFRQVYEFWGTFYQPFPPGPEGEAVRALTIEADAQHLGSTRGLYTISQTVADRLKRSNQIEIDEVLYPPLAEPELFQAGDFGSYFFYPSRLLVLKRQHIAVQAMRFARGDYQLVIAGKADTEAYEQELQGLITRYDLQSRVKLLGWTTEAEKARLMSNSCGVVFIPFDEDYGYVTVEAFHAHKPVITFTDSGGPTEFVQEGITGFVTEPTPEALAAAMDRIWEDRARARLMGQHAYDTLRTRHVSWDYVTERFLS